MTDRDESTVEITHDAESEAKEVSRSGETEQSRGRHVVADTSGETHLGEQLNTLECFCGAKRGEDYYKYPHHLATHSPEDFGLGGGR